MAKLPSKDYRPRHVKPTCCSRVTELFLVVTGHVLSISCIITQAYIVYINILMMGGRGWVSIMAWACERMSMVFVLIEGVGVHCGIVCVFLAILAKTHLSRDSCVEIVNVNH